MGSESVANRSGFVVDENGMPVPGALVAVVASTVPMPEIAVVCDCTGRFEVRLPAGQFTFRAHSGTGTGQADVNDGTLSDPIVIVIDRAAAGTVDSGCGPADP